MDREPIKRELSFFDGIMDSIYTDLEGTILPFHNSLRIAGFAKDSKFVALKDTTLYLENDSCCQKIELKSVEEVLEKVDFYFPLLSDEARRAVKNAKFDK